MALDLVNMKLYWAHSGPYEVGEANLDGTGKMVLFDRSCSGGGGTTNVVDLAIDTTNR